MFFKHIYVTFLCLNLTNTNKCAIILGRMRGDRMLTAYLLLVSMGSMLKGIMYFFIYSFKITIDIYKGVFKLFTLPFRM